MAKASEYLENIYNSPRRYCDMQIVFVDIVSYSRRRPPKQVELIDVFTNILEGAISETAKKYLDSFQERDINLKRDIIILPTGDGAAIVFPFTNPEDIHLYLASQLINSVYYLNSNANCSKFYEQGWCDCHSAFNLRIGLSEGRLILYKDINKNYNIAGNAINMAARVMDFADYNQILLTQYAYDRFIEIAVIPEMEKKFREYKEVKIKHGILISVYQYIDNSISGLNCSLIEKVEPKILYEEINRENSVENIVITIPSDEIRPSKLQDFIIQTGNIDPDVSTELQNLMIEIPSGEFFMGDGKTGQVKVTISKAFLMAKFPIKQSLYELITKSNPSKFKGKDLPVENVTWFEAIEFCNQLSNICGLEQVYTISNKGKTVLISYDKNGYRLPSEAEWEYACRGSTTGDTYGNLDKIARYNMNSEKHTWPVGQLEKNNFGLFDMLGNVWEWCNDWYEKDILNNRKIDPFGPQTGSDRVLRGGSWANPNTNIRSNYRNRENPFTRGDNRGFRIVLSPYI